MTASDRAQLETLKFSAEVIAKAEEVLRAWGDPPLFAKCSHCGKPCVHPDLPRRKNRKKMPAELWHRYELLGFTDTAGEVVCAPCDDFQFEYG